MQHPHPFDERDPVDITRALSSARYLPSATLAEAISTALTLRMPLLLEGEPGYCENGLQSLQDEKTSGMKRL